MKNILLMILALWGGYLTPAFLQKGNNQNLVKGWIQTDGAHNIALLNEYAIEKLSEKAAVEIQAQRNVAKWQEIKDYCESLTLPLNFEEGLKLNGYAGEAEGLTEEIPDRNSTPNVIIKRFIKEDFPLSHTLIRGLLPNPLISSLTEKVFGNGGAQLSDKMDLIVIPTLILFGKYDYICPPKLADDIESRIRSAYKRKVIFENSGHSPMDGQDRKAYWDEVVGFIEAFK